jgi:hypothetical protein
MHAYSDTDLRKFDLCKFFSAFLVFQYGASERSSLTSGRTGGPDGSPLESGRRWSPHVWTGPDGVRTRAVIIVRTVSLYRPDALDLSAPFRGSKRPDIINPPSGRGPHNDHKMLRSPNSLHTPQNHIFWLFVIKVGFKFWHFAYISHISGIFLVFFSSVFFKAVRMLFIFGI